MQISLDIQDDLYTKLVNAGIDMQSKINEYLLSLANKENEYINSRQYQEDRAYFQKALEEVESGKVKLLSQEEYEEEMKHFEQTL